ncbi:hypothetical protein TNCT_423211 [Trichonephila clavata]|uniref:Uncharacterized protein n=1 Tax=Trichonephila clavata TaxID=2740835 RepID=A0A8X6K8N6_TRICU|nr:hypothetical protein TNCT_423211 [Trichonephila clavata]
MLMDMVMSLITGEIKIELGTSLNSSKIVMSRKDINSKLSSNVFQCPLGTISSWMSWVKLVYANVTTVMTATMQFNPNPQELACDGSKKLTCLSLEI